MFTKADELRHADVAVEAWWWWLRSHDSSVAAFVGFELRGRRFDYWAGLARAGQGYLYVEELDGEGLRDGLEIKPPEMWAGHMCDLPFEQWSIGNEAHGVLLDDPLDATRRPFGELAAVTFDIEWYAAGAPEPLALTPGASGYRQTGEADAHIELVDGVLAVEGPAERVHVWGAPWRPALRETGEALPDGQLLPYRRSDGSGVVQVATADGWWARTLDLR